MKMKSGRFVTALTSAMIAMLPIGTLFYAPTAAAAPPKTSSPVVDPEAVTIPGHSASREHRFAILLPTGGRLRALEPRGARGETTSEVMVETASGIAIGAYDAAWAQDAQGKSLPTSYRIDGNVLVQTVQFDARTHFPIQMDPIYSEILARGEIGAGVTAPLTAQSSRYTSVSGLALAAASTYVGIPSNYVYNPSLGVLHDYCTASPDEFPAPFAANANFRGPCAKHDLCYAGSTSEFTCDNRLWSDMVTNCQYYYGSLNPLRYQCINTAHVYWASVVAF